MRALAGISAFLLVAGAAACSGSRSKAQPVVMKAPGPGQPVSPGLPAVPGGTSSSGATSTTEKSDRSGGQPLEERTVVVTRDDPKSKLELVRMLHNRAEWIPISRKPESGGKVVWTFRRVLPASLEGTEPIKPRTPPPAPGTKTDESKDASKDASSESAGSTNP